MSHISRLPPLAGFQVMPRSQSLCPSRSCITNEYGLMVAELCVLRDNGLKGGWGRWGRGGGVCDVQTCRIMVQLLDTCQGFTSSCHSARVCFFVRCVCARVAMQALSNKSTRVTRDVWHIRTHVCIDGKHVYVMSRMGFTTRTKQG